MCKLWWFKMLSRARSAMERAHVWIPAEDKCSAMKFIWTSSGRHFSKLVRCCQQQSQMPGPAQAGQLLAEGCSWKEKKLQETSEEVSSKEVSGSLPHLLLNPLPQHASWVFSYSLGFFQGLRLLSSFAYWILLSFFCCDQVKLSFHLALDQRQNM